MTARDHIWKLGPFALGLAAVAAEVMWHGIGRGSLAWLAAIALLGFGIAAYHPRGWPSLALGTSVLPLTLAVYGAALASLLAVVVVLSRQSARWLIDRREGRPAAEKEAVELLLSLGPVVLAVVVAGWVGIGFDVSPGAATGETTSVVRGLGSGAAYLVVFVAASAVARTSLGRQRPRDLAPFLLDALGWCLGLAVALAVDRLGWLLGLLPLAGLATLSAVAVRADLAARRERKIADRLREVHLAGHRIIFRRPDLLTIARQIHAECAGILSFSWFHLELRAPDGRARSWWAGPETGVAEGRPEPPGAPPQRSGLRGRVHWKLVERDLATSDRLIGRIELWCDPRSVEDGAVDWLDAFLPEVASSIERAFLNREARRDPLTDLGDRRVLEDRLETAFARCLDGGSSMAVVMADLDHFKRINDRHGHAVGDQALVEVARILEKHRRESDVCCRYGGEEFSLVLDDADGETAMGVAERIRVAVENALFVPDGKPGGKTLPLKLSAGIAAFPELHVKTASELVELADEALYEAKRQGRNRCLLNIGRGRFRDSRGGISGPEEPVAEIEPPTLFA